MHVGRRCGRLTMIDAYSRECRTTNVARNLPPDDVLQVLTHLFVERGPRDHIRSDNGMAFVAKEVRARQALREWLP
jgi:transposase InsO family protein